MPTEEVLDALTAHAYPTTTLVEMDATFKGRLKEGYRQDPRWDRIMDQLMANELLGDNASRLPSR